MALASQQCNEFGLRMDFFFGWSIFELLFPILCVVR